MQQAVEDANRRGSTYITLQVVQGSYAEAFYRKLGFYAAFNAKVFAR